MFEDAIDYCNQALDIDPNFTKALFRKAKALAFLFHFKESQKILK